MGAINRKALWFITSYVFCGGGVEGVIFLSGGFFNFFFFIYFFLVGGGFGVGD